MKPPTCPAGITVQRKGNRVVIRGLGLRDSTLEHDELVTRLEAATHNAAIARDRYWIARREMYRYALWLLDSQPALISE